MSSSDEGDHTPELKQEQVTQNTHSDAPSATPQTTPAQTTTTSTSSQTTTAKKPKSDTKDKPKAFTIKYKRPRGSRACTVCRSRKVRCDAEIHIPCTNCITFGCECILPEAKKRGNQSGESKAKRQKTQPKDKAVPTAASTKKKATTTTTTENGDEDGTPPEKTSSSRSAKSPDLVTPAKESETSNHTSSNHTSSTAEPIINISQVSVPPSLTSTYKNRPSMHKKELLDSKAKTALTFLGLSSIGVVPQRAGENHVELTTDVFDTSDIKLDSVELEILKMRGAFLLPSKELSLELINAYFEHVHPLMPVINRSLFMKKFNDPSDNPSLMVLHAVLLLGCRASKNPLLLDSNGTNDLASITFFRRAKALYETNYESDPVSIIQTLILIGSYWDGPEDVTKNSFYWTRVAVGLAQGFGFQRDVSKSHQLMVSEKKIWRRIWWCLFEKDRNVAIAFGRPVVIDLNDCDVPMLTVDDFDETDPELGITDPYPVNETQALYFIHLVKLAEITGIIIKHQYSVKSETMKRRNAFSIIEHCDMLMGIWFTNLPSKLVFSLADNLTHNFFACLLNAQYYNRLYLIHRSNLIRMARSSSTNPNNYKYPSWGISFQSARMISIISKILMDKDLIQFVPVMYVYIAFSALVMLIYHVDSANSVIAATASDSLFVSRAVLRELQKAWPIAGVLLKLFDKYANDKLKRTKLIENGNMIVEYKENAAKEKMKKSISEYGTSTSPTAMPIPNRLPLTQPQQQPQHQHQQVVQQQLPLPQPAKPKDRTLFSPSSVTSGVSPVGNVYNNYPEQTPVKQEFSLVSPVATNPPRQQVQASNPTPQIEELVRQYKLPMKRAAKANNGNGDSSDKQTTETSPASSTKSFPDISMVTENLQNKQNFFENFEPTQLFPTFSIPPTRAQSPTPNFDDGAIGSNVYNAMNATMEIKEEKTPQPQQPGANQQEQPHNGNAAASLAAPAQTLKEEHDILDPHTPGFQTNFIDSSFNYLNLQSGMNMDEDIHSLFNMMNQ
ncbi:Cutinase transcription factor 1 alpha [Candida viswanathii]|uniref:Cutinase transcription factor 1 alpha n=1 Tax=Candida viswanathii TaxID=5486 RepID=A0A367XPZ4_9ASCO|nr:Cutinase transcription factor 1 alpha [Candida viswanathii]